MNDQLLEQKWLEGAKGKICYFSSRQFAGRPTLVFLHGLSSNHTTWNAIIADLKEFQLNFLAPDIRGQGYSDKTKKRNWYKLAVLTQDLKEILEKERIQTPIILVGYSYGGFIALDYTIKYPAGVAGLILISANHVNPFKYWRIDFLTPLAKAGLNLAARLLLWQKRKKYYYFEQGKSKGYWDSTLKGYTTMPLSVNFWLLAEIANIDFGQGIAKISCPTLLIKSQADPFVTAAEAGEMNRRIKNSKLVVTEEQTHFLASRHQKKISQVIIDFMKDKKIIL